MEHRVFISHSSRDAQVAQAICHYLEEAGIRCWIAPRDITTTDWAGSIMQGIQSCDVFVVVLSHNSIPSPEVTKEVTEATRVCDYILPFKVDEEMLTDRLRYHLAPCHWLDAVNPPLELHAKELIARITNLTGEDIVYKNQGRQRLAGTTVLPKSFFVGREEELDQIHQMLQEEHVLFLQGMGGIGKSEIAKGYAKTHKDSYDTVLFATYNGSIQDMIIGEEIEVENLRRNLSYGEDAESAEAFFKRKLKAIKDLSNERTLLIIDNFDTGEDALLEELIQGPYHILFTTRYEHYDYPCLPVGPIRDFDMVRQVFARNFGRPIASKDRNTVDEILRLVHCHTITVELIAKQMRASFMPPAKMLERLQIGGMNSGLRETVKRGGSGKSAFDFIKDLFHLSSLTQEAQFVLQCMCLIPSSGIDVNLLGEYMEWESFDVVNELIGKSWLMLDEETYYLKMHPIICDVVKDQLHPDQTSCSAYVMGLWKDMKQAWWKTAEERAEKWPYVDHLLRYYGDPTAELLQQYMDLANAAWVCSQFPQAIAASKKVYEFTLRQVGDAGYQAAFAARTVAGAYFNAGDDEGAEPYYYLGLEHMLKKPEESYKELGYAYQKVGRCAYSHHDFEKAEEYLRLSLEAFEKASQDPAEGMTAITNLDTYVNYARMYMEKGEYETALRYAQKSYDISYGWKNCEVTSSAYALSDMGICYSHLGQYEKAQEYLQRALDLNIQFNGEASMVTVRTRESIADNQARQGRVAEAKSAYLALELEMEKSFGSQCPQCIRLRDKGEAL